MPPTPLPTPFPTKDPTICDATRADTCKADPSCKTKPGGAPKGVIEEWTNRGNMNCYDLGFDFGWKTGEPGCFNEIQSPFTADDETLMQTRIRECTDCEGTVPHATYQVNCREAEGNRFKFADITASTDMFVYAKAQTGSGYLFGYSAGTQLTVSTPGYQAITSMEFCFVCGGDNAQPVVNGIPVPRTTQNQCDGSYAINYDLARSAQELNVKVQAFPMDQDGLFDITIYDSPYAPAGMSTTAPGWCIDYDRFIGSKFYMMDIFSGFDKQLHSDAVDKPEFLPNVAWLINNVNVGDLWDTNGCKGTVGWKEYQGAIWKLIDNKDGSDHSYYGKRIECISNAIYQRALFEGNNYVPDCSNPSEQVPLIFVSDTDTHIDNQVIFSETYMSTIEGLCECVTSKPTGWPTLRPTAAPTTAKPTSFPTAKPTAFPTVKPTESPTDFPTAKPTEAPTAKPTEVPTTRPTEAPTEAPTEMPTGFPTAAPTPKTSLRTQPEEEVNDKTTPPTGAPVATPIQDDTMAPTSPPGTKGDPHFKTHGGEMYDVSIRGRSIFFLALKPSPFRSSHHFDANIIRCNDSSMEDVTWS